MTATKTRAFRLKLLPQISWTLRHFNEPGQAQEWRISEFRLMAKGPHKEVIAKGVNEDEFAVAALTGAIYEACDDVWQVFIHHGNKLDSIVSNPVNLRRQKGFRTNPLTANYLQKVRATIGIMRRWRKEIPQRLAMLPEYGWPPAAMPALPWEGEEDWLDMLYKTAVMKRTRK